MWPGASRVTPGEGTRLIRLWCTLLSLCVCVCARGTGGKPPASSVFALGISFAAGVLSLVILVFHKVNADKIWRRVPDDNQKRARILNHAAGFMGTLTC